jgi:hypothetical protein
LVKGRSLVQFDLTMQGGIEEPSGGDFKQYLKSRIHGSEMAPAETRLLAFTVRRSLEKRGGTVNLKLHVNGAENAINRHFSA